MKAENVEVWSCGGGTQSGAIAALIGDGTLPKPDLCLMVDTGRERSSSWDFVNAFICTQLAKVDLELIVIPKEDFATVDLIALNGDILLPGFTSQNGSIGKLPAFCSVEWKKRVVERYMRSIGTVSCRKWMGMSCDEMKRVRTPDCLWMQIWYPLIFELHMTRLDCIQKIRSTGYKGPIPHSACWMCANHSDEEWLEMKMYQPEDFSKACALEVAMQIKDPHFWLHPSCKPLAEVDFTAQYTMFADRGCTGGCFT
jgi:hypothetical protein